MTKNLVLIDGNAIMHRAFHALPPLSTPTNEPIGAVYGFITMLLRIIEDLEPTYLAACFDRKEPTFRKKMDITYQAHRPETDVDLISQFPKVRSLLRAMHIPTFDQAGYEADDLIGTISQHAKADQIIVVTGDKDILQLVNNKVKVYLPVKGLSQGQLMDANAVVKKLGIAPSQVVDYKALVGDPSDNYKGVPGIGPKTAIKLLTEYQSLLNIYSSLDKLPPAIRQKLEAGKASALLSQNLAQIMQSVPLKFDLQSAALWQINSEEALELLKIEYGFRSIPRRIEVLSKKLLSKNQTSLF